jgi:putative hydrolase of the HAD superfamily
MLNGVFSAMFSYGEIWQRTIMIFYRNWHKPKLLTIDLDDTLYDNGPVIARAEEYIKTKIGVEYLDGSRLSDSLYYAVRGKMLDICPELEYDVSMLRYFIFKELLTGSGITSDDACRLAEDLMHDFISVRSEINVPRETLDVLHRLKKYYPIIGLTNGNSNPKIAGYDECFDDVIWSGVNIPSKPHPHMFHQAATLADVDLEDVCHIGDNETTDILGAINAGVMCVRQTQYHREESELKILPHVSINHISELIDLLL